MTYTNQMQKNEHYKVTIEKLGEAGDGITAINGKPLYIPGALPGETVETRIIKVHASYGVGKLIQRFSGSPNRIQPPCPIAERCGGCQIQHLAYEAQLHYKMDTLRQLLKFYPALKEVPIRPILPAQSPFHYRNKAQLSIETHPMQTGFYAVKSHRIIDMDACAIEHPTINAALTLIRNTLRQLPVIDPKITATQNPTHCVIRYGWNSGKLMIALVTQGQLLAESTAWIMQLREIPGIKSILHNINPMPGNTILGPETHVLWGEPTITDTIAGVRCQLSLHSFTQSNPCQTQVLYQTAKDYAELSGKETVWDLYSGIGTIALFLATQAAEVIGIEEVPSAVQDAAQNAKLNQIHNARFICGKAEVIWPALRKTGDDIVLMDPPRKGCETPVLDALIQSPPDKLIYISCNPKTLFRDLDYLQKHGLKTTEIQPVDMFPHTIHIEAVAKVTR